MRAVAALLHGWRRPLTIAIIIFFMLLIFVKTARADSITLTMISESQGCIDLLNPFYLWDSTPLAVVAAASSMPIR